MRKTGLYLCVLFITFLLAIPVMAREASQDFPSIFKSENFRDGTLHGNYKSRKFHKEGCRYYNCKTCTRIFKTAVQAKKAGYKPCEICFEQ